MQFDSHAPQLRAPDRDLSPLADPFPPSPRHRSHGGDDASSNRTRASATNRDHDDDWASAQIADDHFRVSKLARGCKALLAQANRRRVNRAAAAIGDRSRLRAALAIWAEPPPLPWYRAT